ncbi:hypothetical protein B0O99DRAFT_595483 [Bisporella sp. PMI_857]|nr:hypothetical protein B0O99DRAFT_595483 [Bisporella sp. PMI_857]
MVNHILIDQIEAEQMKIVDWLKTEPNQPLRSGHIAVSVHSGGANSYYECTKVILPYLFDTHDFAARIESLGIGIWSSKKSAPFIDGEEAGAALVTAVADVKSHGSELTTRARELGETMKRYKGTKSSADKILN